MISLEIVGAENAYEIIVDNEYNDSHTHFGPYNWDEAQKQLQSMANDITKNNLTEFGTIMGIKQIVLAGISRQ
jgi:hypothetical protein